MKVVPYFALLCAAFIARPALAQMSYREAESAAAAQVSEASLVKWGQENLSPIFEENFRSLLETCMRVASDAEPNAVRLVVILNHETVSIAIDPEGSMGISECIARELKMWNWPTPPSIVYLPLKLNTRPPDSKDVEREADHILEGISPSNKSLERTRER